MNLITAQKLIKLNYAFYQTIGKYFDSSRNYSWPGWKRLKTIFQIPNPKLQKQELHVLDLGCGNARFAEFLLKECKIENLDYTGIDYSEFLIEKGDDKLTQLQISNFKLQIENILLGEWEKNLTDGGFDVIVMFGVMHHVPSNELRLKLLKKIYSLMNADSVFVVTFWKFKDIPRLERRIIREGSDELSQVLESFDLHLDDLEENDHILDWERGMKAYRYCHYYSTAEATALLEQAGFRVKESYLADAKEDVVNEYMICSKS
jgi:tRNA (uracil-5-)-methyltransferase TRM9